MPFIERKRVKHSYLLTSEGIPADFYQFAKQRYLHYAVDNQLFGKLAVVDLRQKQHVWARSNGEV